MAAESEARTRKTRRLSSDSRTCVVPLRGQTFGLPLRAVSANRRAKRDEDELVHVSLDEIQEEADGWARRQSVQTPCRGAGMGGWRGKPRKSICSPTGRGMGE